MKLIDIYPTRIRKHIRSLERYCSSFMCPYLFKYVVNEKNGWYHVLECIGKKKVNGVIRPLFRHYLVPHYDYYKDQPVVSLCSVPYDVNVNKNLVHKMYHVTTYEFK